MNYDSYYTFAYLPMNTFRTITYEMPDKQNKQPMYVKKERKMNAW